EQADSVLLDGGTLVVTFGAGADGVRRMLVGQGHPKTIETLVSAAIGRPVTLRVEGGGARADGASATPASDRDPPGHRTLRESGGARGGPAAPLMERARKDPAVRTLLDAFGAQIVDVRAAGPEATPGPPAVRPEETP